VKPNVVFHGQDVDLPEVINAVSFPSSSSCSPPLPHRQTRVRTAQELLVSLKPESVQFENEEEERDPAGRQLTIDENCSLPEDFYFSIDDPEEKVLVHPLDHGLLFVNCTA
jgi:hypothetical protein